MNSIVHEPCIRWQIAILHMAYLFYDVFQILKIKKSLKRLFFIARLLVFFRRLAVGNQRTNTMVGKDFK